MKNIILLFVGFILIFPWVWNDHTEVVTNETKIIGTIYNDEAVLLVCVGRVHGLTQDGIHLQTGRGPWIVRAEETREISLTTSRVDPFVYGWIDRMRCHRIR